MSATDYGDAYMDPEPTKRSDAPQGPDTHPDGSPQVEWKRLIDMPTDTLAHRVVGSFILAKGNLNAYTAIVKNLLDEIAKEHALALSETAPRLPQEPTHAMLKALAGDPVILAGSDEAELRLRYAAMLAVSPACASPNRHADLVADLQCAIAALNNSAPGMRREELALLCQRAADALSERLDK